MSEKVYDVPAEWAKRAFVDEAHYEEMYRRSIADPDAFWREHGRRIDWSKPYSKISPTSRGDVGKPVAIKWFGGWRDQRRL